MTPTKQPKPLPPLMSNAKFAARLGVSDRTLKDWTKQGILPEPIYINGRKYWPIGTEPKQEPGPRPVVTGSERQRRKAQQEARR